MAIFVVLEDFSNGRVSFTAGSILDDATIDLAPLRASGLCDTAMIPGMEDVIARFIGIRASGVPSRENDLPTLIQRSIYGASAVNTSTGQSVEDRLTSGGGILAGDVDGPANANTVIGINNIPVNTPSPTAGDVLQYDGLEYVNAALPAQAPATQIETTTGPTVLDIGAIGLGQVLQRVGTDIVGLTVPVVTATAASTILPDDAAAPGTSPDAARVDHVHGIATDVVVDAGTANAEGSSTSFSRADHVHNVPFSAVQNALNLASSSISVNAQHIVSLRDPVADQDAATKFYVDAVAQGLQLKAAVRAATTPASGNIVLSGLQTIDIVSLLAGDRVLVKDQTLGEENGIYVVSAGPWSRSPDADISSEVTTGTFVLVQEGTVNGNNGWVLITPAPIVLNTTPLTFTQFSGPGLTVAGNGLQKLGNVLSVLPADGSIVASGIGTAVGVISDAQHGNRGGGSLHAVATTTVDGFMSAADKVALNAAAVVGGGPPVNVDPAAASNGVALTASRSDHKHSVLTAAAGTITIGAAAAAGVLTSLSRADHVHALPAPSAPVTLTTAGSTAGTSTAAARADHRHAISLGTPVAITDSTNANGVATSFPRSDHQHAHGNRGGGTLHAAATTLVNGFMTSTQVTELAALVAGTTPTLAGDVDGAPNANTVNSLQTVPLALGGITNGDFLSFNGTSIVPVLTPSGSVLAENAVRVDPSGSDITGTLGDLSKPFLTIQAAINAAAASPSTESFYVLLPPVSFESVTIPPFASIQQLIFAPFTASADWYGSTLFPTPTVTMTPTSGGCLSFRVLISGIGAPALLANGNGSQSFGCFYGGFERDGSTTDLVVDATNISVFYLEAGLASGAYSHVDATFVVASRNSIPDALGPFSITGNTVQTLFVALDVYLNTVNLFGDFTAFISQNTQVSGTLKTLGVASTSSIIFQGNAGTLDLEPVGVNLSSGPVRANSLILRPSTLGPVVVDAEFCTVRDTIDIGNDVQLTLNGAAYDPDGVSTSGTGTYTDNVNPRTVTVTQAIAGNSYTVRPRDSIVVMDNTASTATVFLGPAVNSLGQVTIFCASDPAIFSIDILPFPGDNIDGGSSITFNQTGDRVITLGCDPATQGWGILNVYPGTAAPPAPLAFPTEPGTSFTLGTFESGVVMTNPGVARTVSFPAFVVPDGTSFVVVDGAGTAAINAITVNTNGTDTINGAGTSDSIASNFAAVTYRYSASAANWSKI